MHLQLWKPYAPSKERPWNICRVVHLHRRAAFAATWPEVQRDLRDGPEKSIDRLLTGTAAQTGMPDGFEALSNRLGETAVASGRVHRLRAWWLFRAIFLAGRVSTRRSSFPFADHESRHETRPANSRRDPTGRRK